LLLSSDGLHGAISPEAMRDVLMSATEPDEAVHRLVAAAREAGGPDNISCIVIDCRE
jgi:serine/threonine protein phosphatase PrpC